MFYHPKYLYFCKTLYPMKTRILISNQKPIAKIGKKQLIFAHDIILLQAEINYTYLFLADGQKIIVSYHLGKLQEKLSHFQTFIRPNRHTIVNLNFVTSLNANSLEINGTTISISRRRKEFFFDSFKEFKSLNK